MDNELNSEDGELVLTFIPVPASCVVILGVQLIKNAVQGVHTLRIRDCVCTSTSDICFSIEAIMQEMGCSGLGSGICHATIHTAFTM